MDEHLQNEIVVELDGIHTGIFAYIPEKDSPLTVKERITFGQRKAWLFRNYDIMMSTLVYDKRKLNELRYAIKYGNNDYASYDSFQYVNGVYIGYLGDVKLTIVPDTTRRVSRVFYIQINQPESDYAEFELQKETFRLFRKAAKTLPAKYSGKVLINPFDENGFFEIKAVDTTVKLHVGSTAKIAKLNKDRMQEGKPCIPYIKDVPKYTTLYCYGDKDLYAPIIYDEVIDILLKDVCDQINTLFPGVSASLIPCEIKKKLTI